MIICPQLPHNEKETETVLASTIPPQSVVTFSDEEITNNPTTSSDANNNPQVILTSPAPAKLQSTTEAQTTAPVPQIVVTSPEPLPQILVTSQVIS